MLEIELIELVENIRRQKCESNYIELKSAEKGCPRLFALTIPDKPKSKKQKYFSQF